MFWDGEQWMIRQMDRGNHAVLVWTSEVEMQEGDEDREDDTFS